MKNIRKLRSEVYDKVIEVRVPVRFYWTEAGYDGFEFGPLCDCAHHQLRLLDEVIDQLGSDSNYAKVARHLEEGHTAEWQNILDREEAETLKVPQAVLDAFREHLL